MYRHGIVIFCLAIVHPFLCYGKMGMIDDPILEYLKMDPNTVIEHELVNIELPDNIHKRSIDENSFKNGAHMRFRVFNDQTNMWLHPRDSLFASDDTPVYIVYKNESRSGGVSYVRQEGAMARLGRLFENAQYRASFVIGSDSYTNKPVVSGYYAGPERGPERGRGDTTAIIIKPLPAHIVEEHLRKRRSIGDNENSALNSARHVALRVENQIPDHSMSYGYKKVSKRDDWLQHRKPVVLPEDFHDPYDNTIFPELFLHFDVTYYDRRFEEPESEQLLRFLEYALAFWNGVDLSYRHVENPNIRLHISGIAVATNESTPYIKADWPNYNFDQDIAIKKSAIFFDTVGDQIPLESYDVAITMTKLNMQRPTIGIALFSGACSLAAMEGQYVRIGVAMVEDNGAFSGIDTAVHELAHTMGVDHDDRTPKCLVDKSYIMGSEQFASVNKARFSPCSLAWFNLQLRNNWKTCLYNRPQTKVNLPKLMPGKMATLDEQCRSADHYSQGACTGPDRDPCVVLQCLKYTRNWEGQYTLRCDNRSIGAAPGSDCGFDYSTMKPKFCLQKQCVTLQ